MAVQQRLYDIDDFSRLVSEADDGKRYELIEGEIIEMTRPGLLHGRMATRLGRYLDEFAERHALGIVTVETGFHPPDSRYTVLGPDVAYISNERVPQPHSEGWVPAMPDLAVEIKSPGNTLAELRRKAAIYLRHGARLVWIILPDTESVEVHRLGADGERQRDVVGIDSQLSGEDVLPGFRLALSTLYA